MNEQDPTPAPAMTRDDNRLPLDAFIRSISTAGTDQPDHALRPKGGDDAGGTAAPVIAGKDRPIDSEAIHQCQQIRAKCCLLA